MVYVEFSSCCELWINSRKLKIRGKILKSNLSSNRRRGIFIRGCGLSTAISAFTVAAASEIRTPFSTGERSTPGAADERNTVLVHTGRILPQLFQRVELIMRSRYPKFDKLTNRILLSPALSFFPSKFRKILPLIVFLFLAENSSQAQFAVGIDGGLSMVKLSGDSPDNTDYSGKSGYLGGLLFEYYITKDIRLSFQPNYSHYGTTIGYDIGEEDYKDSFEVDVSYFRLPLVVIFDALNNYTYFSSGIDIGLRDKATLKDVSEAEPEEDITNAFEDIDVSAMFGAGLKFPIESFQVRIEARFMQSLTNLNSGEGTSRNDLLNFRFRFSGLQLLTGVTYKF